MATDPISITPALVKALLPQRSDQGHKGDFGAALLITGSQRYTGAAYLAGSAARCAPGRPGIHGCSRLSASSPRRSAPCCHLGTVTSRLPGKFSPAGCPSLGALLERKTALLIGPGLGQGAGATAILDTWLSLANLPPTVLDADALRLLAKKLSDREHLPDQSLLTPHAGEMAALTGLDIEDVLANREELARNFALSKGVTLVLKGANTLVATPEGNLYQSEVSSSALAHGGSGDVLAGLITGLLAQNVHPASAAISGVWLHAKAGLLALEQRGWAGAVLPNDLLDFIGLAVRAASQ